MFVAIALVFSKVRSFAVHNLILPLNNLLLDRCCLTYCNPALIMSMNFLLFAYPKIIP